MASEKYLYSSWQFLLLANREKVAVWVFLCLHLSLHLFIYLTLSLEYTLCYASVKVFMFNSCQELS